METSEKNAFTKKVDIVKNKITKVRSDLRVKVATNKKMIVDAIKYMISSGGIASS